SSDVAVRPWQPQTDGCVVSPAPARRFGGEEPIADPVLSEQSTGSRSQGAFEDPRCEAGHDCTDSSSQQSDPSSSTSHHSEGPVSDFDQLEGDGPTLALIAVQCLLVHVPSGNICEEVGQVVRVLKTGVHSLPPRPVNGRGRHPRPRTLLLCGIVKPLDGGLGSSRTNRHAYS